MGDRARTHSYGSREHARATEGDGSFGQLEIKTAVGPSGAPLIGLSGEIDLESVAELRSAIASATAGHPDRLVLDMSGVSFVDSSGIHALIDATELAGSVCLRSPSRQVRCVIEIVGLTRMLSVEP